MKIFLTITFLIALKTLCLNTTFSNIQKETINQTSINLRFDFENKIMHGNTNLVFNILQNTNFVTLDTKNLNIIQIFDVNNNNLSWVLDYNRTSEIFGTPLIIYFPTVQNASSQYSLNIIYETSNEAEGLIWFDRNQTISKRFPAVYAKPDKINSRTIQPTQDTLLNLNQYNPNFKLETPILGVGPSYYFNLLEYGTISNYSYGNSTNINGNFNPNQFPFAVGQLEHTQIGLATALWAQNSIKEYSLREFVNVEKFFQIIVGYFGYQNCTTFNVIVATSGFPSKSDNGYCISIISPSLIAGDRSLESFVISDLATGWFGSQVTAIDWESYWIPIALAKYTSKLVIKDYYNEDLSELVLDQIQKKLALKINENINTTSYNSTQLSYVPENPNDLDDQLLELKGCLFFQNLENVIGVENVLTILNNIIQNVYISNSILKSDILNFISQNSTFSQETIEKIYFDEWINQPGFAPVHLEFESNLKQKAINLSLSFIEGNVDKALVSTFNSWDVYTKLEFIDNLLENKDKITDEIYLNIRSLLQLYKNQNSEVIFGWFLFSLKINQTEDIEYLENILSRTGRIDLILPIFKELISLNPDQAKLIYENSSFLYSKVTRDALNDLFN